MTVEFHIGILPDRPAAEVAELAAYAEALGFRGVWVADSQSIFRDAFAALTLCATRTSSMLLATGVTNPLTRHPAVLAGAFATLDELSGGRAVLGMGVGESAVHTIGRRPAKLATMAEVTLAARDLMRGRRVTFDGTELHLPWSRREVPVVFASSGPRSLRLSGRVADGVLFQVGADPSYVRYAIDAVHEGARAAGRDSREVRLLARLACSVHADGRHAREQVKAYASAAAGTVFAALPQEVLEADLTADIRAMKERYDYFEHASQRARHKELMTDRIVDAISISGTPEEAVPRFRRLVGLGVQGFVLPITGDAPESTIRMLAEDVIPHVAGAAATAG